MAKSLTCIHIFHAVYLGEQGRMSASDFCMYLYVCVLMYDNVYVSMSVCGFATQPHASF